MDNERKEEESMGDNFMFCACMGKVLLEEKKN